MENLLKVFIKNIDTEDIKEGFKTYKEALDYFNEHDIDKRFFYIEDSLLRKDTPHVVASCDDCKKDFTAYTYQELIKGLECPFCSSTKTRIILN